VKSVHIVHCITYFVMPRGKEQKQKPKGQGRPKRKTKSNRPTNWNKSGTTAQMRRGDIPAPAGMGDGRGRMQSAPVAQQRLIKTGRPQMSSMRNGDCRVVHREYIQDISADSAGPPTTFAVTQFSVNPGQATAFPWLSTIAKNFESYRFRKLRFCYETEAPSSLGGSLVVALDYDATDAAPTTKQQAMAYRGSVRSAPWEPCCHSSVLEDLNKQKSYFVRPAAQPANTDIKMYDTGNLFVCTQNVTTASAVCGELYVEYDIDLLTPVYEGPTGGTSGALSSTTATVASPLLAATAATGNTIGVSAALTVATMTNLAIGSEYLLMYSTTADVTVSFGTYTGCTLKTILAGNGESYTLCATVSATASTASIAITVGGAPGTAYFAVAAMPTGSSW